EELLHVLGEGDGDARLADLAARHVVAGVVAHLGGEVERDGDSGLALAEEVAIPPVGLDGRAVPRVLAYRPRPRDVHGGVDAAGEGELAGEPEPCRVIKAGI